MSNIGSRGMHAVEKSKRGIRGVLRKLFSYSSKLKDVYQSQESNSWAWMGFTAVFQLAVAWVVTFIVYQIGMLLV